MTPTAYLRRAVAGLLALSLTAGVAVAWTAPAQADPDDEKHNEQLVQNLETAARGYLDAQAALESSRQRQAELKAALTAVEAELGPLRAEVEQVAAAAYQNGRLNTIEALLGSADPDQFLVRATMLQELTYREDEAIGRLSAAEERARRDKEAIDAEAAEQAAQSAEMKKRMKAAEVAIVAQGGQYATGYLDPNSPAAIPAPRAKDGSWPAERCSVDDPTKTGGCITPRLLHAYNEARAAKFTRYTKCWRTQSWGEHPKGRACDFSVSVGGFSGTATGGDRAYGDRLASFFIKNASALGILYVIWYRRIWFPGLGWRSYSGCCGASPEHTNHVHLSMY